MLGSHEWFRITCGCVLRVVWSRWSGIKWLELAGVAWSGLEWTEWPGVGWSGLEWIAMGWSGLEWIEMQFDKASIL